MKLLIAVSSKHGSTREIAASIGETVREAGIEVDVVDAQDVESVAPYDAVIVGSAVHWGRWMGPARDLVNGSADALRTRPVWLFSSGPLGRDIVDPADAAEGMKLLELVGATGASGLRRQGGQAASSASSSGGSSRWSSHPWGDHRDWPAIREWAASIARELTTVPAGDRT